MLDDTPVTVTIPADQLGHALGAVRAHLKKRERDLARGKFEPEPGHLNMTEVKIAKLRDAKDTLGAALQEHLAERDDHTDDRCSCVLRAARSTDIDPPEGRVLDQWCPVHGRDPDAERERIRDNNEGY